MRDYLRKLAKQKIIRRFIVSNLPLFLILLGAILILLLIIVTYQVMTSGSYLTSDRASSRDAAIKARYETLADTWSRKDCWLVDDEGTHYPHTGLQNLGQMVDHDRKDYALRLKWGTIHGVLLYYDYRYNMDHIPNRPEEKLPDQVAESLHPYFYYVLRYDQYPSDQGTISVPVYLLIEAHTLEGWYKYTYIQKHYDDGSIRWVLKDVKELYRDRFKYLKDYLTALYKVKNVEDDQTYMLVYQAGEGFFNQSEWLEFLMKHPGTAAVYTTAGSMPPEYAAMLDEAEQKFGIPSWFLAAVIYRESSWDPMAENASGCFGLTQQHPDYYRERWIKLGFDPDQDKWNPRAQILAGAMVLKDYCGTVDWKHYKTDQNLINGLAHYGGFQNTDEAQGYTNDIFKLAESYTRPTSWPLPSYTRISSYFGWRTDPITGEQTLHHGVDIPAPVGTQVLSASAGQVVYTGYNADYGNHIRIRDTTHEYLYAHLSEIAVKNGQQVNPGKVIALSGNTGRTTGPHLHFGVKDLLNDCWIDPLSVISKP